MSALVAGPAAAQASASVATQASAEILDPAQVSHGASAATDVARPQSGSKTAIAGSSSYRVVAKDGQTYTVSAPETVKMTRVGGAEEIEFKLTSRRNAATAIAGGDADVRSTTIDVTASGPVSSTTAVGLYQGEYKVTVDYQ